jgi:hypothetical protein
MDERSTINFSPSLMAIPLKIKSFSDEKVQKVDRDGREGI